ncbi:16S rRNA (uracil(1498)-N(3))-methyltransferase [Basilea psittacipulmonis]|uniref:Ribosomal RNA small subunit methyltransferase E n=1 Tax=Basilea psittacipulmonis DSM 24701 TaxID=1072685 RepID=A0A077DC91_9BURK|nr:16S rRNA (uracil(1498)-N(3))-methyltransferase [Basilea psittacipulmonis]AIL32510.1 hypothetical protein IX83_03595 [Basilea psittacipulmonis DSM 24701]
MATPRFYCSISLNQEEKVTLSKEASHHAMRALRLHNGDEVILFNGKGGQWKGKIDFSGGHACITQLEFEAIERETKGSLTLVQALASSEKMDWIIEKAVELGVHQIIPIQAQRSVLQLSGDRLEKRMQRWQNIIQSASEQCGRNQLLSLQPLQTLNTLSFPENSLVLLAHPYASLSLNEVLASHTDQPIFICVGPEGGWSSSEIQTLTDKGAVLFQHGQRVLRTETAGMAFSAAIFTLKNWM